MVTGNTGENLSMSEAAGQYLAVIPHEKKDAAQREINNFIRWYGGREKSFIGLEGSAVGDYAERLAQTDADCIRKLELVRGFLAYAYKQHWCQENLSVSIRIVKTTRSSTNKKASAKKNNGKKEPVYMTKDAFEKVELELKDFREKRLAIIEDVKRAAADKDFKENAPYHAAREQKSFIEGKILELGEMVASVAIIDENRKVTHKASMGDTVVLQDLASRRELRYTLVGPREVAPAKGKISTSSPVGKAVAGKAVGDMIEVVVPSGKLSFQLKEITH